MSSLYPLSLDTYTRPTWLWGHSWRNITRLVKLVVFPDFKHGLPRELRVGGFSSSSELLAEKPRCSNSLDTCALRAGLARRVLMVGLGFESGCFCFCSSVFCCCRVINLAFRRATSVSHSRTSFLALTHAIYCGGWLQQLRLLLGHLNSYGSPEK